MFFLCIIIFLLKRVQGFFLMLFFERYPPGYHTARTQYSRVFNNTVDHRIAELTPGFRSYISIVVAGYTILALIPPLTNSFYSTLSLQILLTVCIERTIVKFLRLSNQRQELYQDLITLSTNEDLIELVNTSSTCLALKDNVLDFKDLINCPYDTLHFILSEDTLRQLTADTRNTKLIKDSFISGTIAATMQFGVVVLERNNLGVNLAGRINSFLSRHFNTKTKMQYLRENQYDHEYLNLFFGLPPQVGFHTLEVSSISTDLETNPIHIVHNNLICLPQDSAPNLIIQQPEVLLAIEVPMTFINAENVLVANETPTDDLGYQAREDAARLPLNIPRPPANNNYNASFLINLLAHPATFSISALLCMGALLILGLVSPLGIGLIVACSVVSVVSFGLFATGVTTWAMRRRGNNQNDNTEYSADFNPFAP